MTKKEVLEKLFDKKLKAFARLEGLAEKYNGDWTPNWDNAEQDKYYIGTDFQTIDIHNRKSKAAAGVVYFKDKDSAESALEDMFESGLVDFLFDAQTYFIEEHDGEHYLTVTLPDLVKTAQILVKKSGSTTNLDIKNSLREQGYWVTQKIVSEGMDNVGSDEGLRSTTNGTYRTWYAI